LTFPDSTEGKGGDVRFRWGAEEHWTESEDEWVEPEFMRRNRGLVQKGALLESPQDKGVHLENHYLNDAKRGKGRHETLDRQRKFSEKWGRFLSLAPSSHISLEGRDNLQTCLILSETERKSLVRHVLYVEYKPPQLVTPRNEE